MKKLVMTVAVLTCAASIVSAQTVTSANAVGYSKLTLEPGFNMVRTAFTDGAQAPVDLQEIFDTSLLLQAGAYADADQILFWDEAAVAYQAYYLHDGSGKTGTGKDGKWVDKATSTVAVKVVLPQEGFFFTRNDVAIEVITSGEVVSSATGTNSVVLLDGVNLIANPFTSEWKLNDGSIDWIAQGAVAAGAYADADQLQFWNVATLQYQAYYLHDGSGKTGTGKDGKWVDKETSSVDVNLGVGLTESLFYSKQAGAGSITIDVAQPYGL